MSGARRREIVRPPRHDAWNDWDVAEHGHCSCGARLLDMPCGRAPLCAACGWEEAACPCAPTTCESCGATPAPAPIGPR